MLQCFPWPADKYVKVLEELKRQFSAAHRAQDTNRMKRFATTLQLFQEGYHKLIEMFVEECLPPVSQATTTCKTGSSHSPTLPLPSPPPLLPCTLQKDTTYSSDSEMFTQVEILCQQVCVCVCVRACCHCEIKCVCMCVHACVLVTHGVIPGCPP